MLSEVEFRSQIQSLFDRIEKALDPVDPDLVECESQHGALSLKVAGGKKVILSAQPSVKQLWLAVASRGQAFHFNWDEERKCWVDDKGLGIEPASYLMMYIQEESGLAVLL